MRARRCRIGREDPDPSSKAVPVSFIVSAHNPLPALLTRATLSHSGEGERSETPMICNDVAITPELVKEHGLKPDEY